MELATLKPGSTSKISLDQLAALLEQSEIAETLDLGNTLIHRVNHPQHGKIVLINTTGENHAVLS